MKRATCTDAIAASTTMHTAHTTAAASIPKRGMNTTLPTTLRPSTTTLFTAAHPLRPLMISSEWMFPAMNVTTEPAHRATRTPAPASNPSPRIRMSAGEKTAMRT